MVKLTIQFTRKQISYITRNVMANKNNAINVERYFPTFSDVRETIRNGSYGPDDNVAVIVDPIILLEVHNILTIRREGLTSKIHREMKISLADQLSVMADPEQTTDPEINESAYYVITILLQRDAANDELIAQEILEGEILLGVPQPAPEPEP